MTKRIKKPYTCHLTPEQFELLHKLNEVTKVPISVLIREGIDLVIDSRKDQLKLWKPKE